MGNFSFLILRITRCICICMDRIDLLELQRKWGYVLIEPFISLPSQKARYTYTLQYAICILYKEKGKLLRRRLSYVPAPFSRLNLITIDSLNLLLLRDGFTAVIISSPPKKNSHFPAFLIAASQPRRPAWTSELPPYLFLRSPAILDPTVSHNN
jgi:hypothetical protein